MEPSPEIKLKIACEMLKYKVKLYFDYAHFSLLRKHLMCTMHKRYLVRSYLMKEFNQSQL